MCRFFGEICTISINEILVSFVVCWRSIDSLVNARVTQRQASHRKPTKRLTEEDPVWFTRADAIARNEKCSFACILRLHLYFQCVNLVKSKRKQACICVVRVSLSEISLKPSLGRFLIKRHSTELILTDGAFASWKLTIASRSFSLNIFLLSCSFTQMFFQTKSKESSIFRNFSKRVPYLGFLKGIPYIGFSKVGSIFRIFQRGFHI